MNFKKFKKTLSCLVITALTVSILPATYSYASTTQDKKIDIPKEKQLQRKIIGYFPEWAYKSQVQGNFNVTNLQWDSLTHIQYSFAGIDPSTNKIKFGDKHAAIEEDFKDYKLNFKGKPVTLDPNLPYKGHFNVLQTMKKQYPNVDLLMSVGGWAGSRGFYTMLDTDAGINTFADSCVDFIRTYNFNGIDIDFEYPSSTSQSGNPADFDLSESRRGKLNERYNLMIKTLREKLDAASSKDGKPYLLTAAVTASSWVLGGVPNNEYAKYLDFLSVMSYDFHGGWNKYVENLANIKPDPNDTETLNMLMPTLSMDWAYRFYRGVLPPEKIIMGIPYYTRGWQNVSGGTNGLHGSSAEPASGKYNVWGDPTKDGNSLEPAGANPLWHVLNLMENDKNLKKYDDPIGGVPHVWQDKERVFLSFEDENSIDNRVNYIKEKNLGGALIWVMNGDYGLNPNYVEGSTKVNEGKYCFGDTLTSRLKKDLNNIGACTETPDGNSNLAPINVDVKLTGVYDHPNYTYALTVKNNTTETIKGGWKVSFDLPKSAVFKSSWGGSSEVKDNGDFNTVTLTSGAWQNLAPNASTTLQGMIGLCFSGVRNITFNGMRPSSEVVPPSENTAPSILGAADVQIKKGSTFDVKAGVTSTDKEDGDLTSKIIISGSVDTSKTGTYKIIYSVTDSKNLTTSITRTITVIDDVVEPTNTAPILSGVTDKTITVSDSFNPLANISATDKEDGDLTNFIKVSGSVDTSKAGTYTLVYSVTDKNGATTTAKAIITVKEKVISSDTYDANKIYNTGDTVIYKGAKYKANWWTKGDIPDKSSAWELVIDSNPDGSKPYVPGKSYSGGEKVSYNGLIYKANWWTTSVPGSDSSWSLVK
ncbi:chitinase [Clostridium cavendishii DSM 21758]|uniref:Chitinase n=2 Tax=Clostridium TaxID=1485 RepID=A0A1M6E8G0_9CLOT|nr:glycosyl hydrolase family 18 protein [Clostridium cavendishii]SHI81630.1 chitinase [Clostridium cavendishii DSM 21758]